jgi:hypothetical protein
MNDTLEALILRLRDLRAQSASAWEQAADTEQRSAAIAAATTALAQWDAVIDAAARGDHDAAIITLWPAAAEARDWGDSAPEDAALDAIQEYVDHVKPCCECGELTGDTCGWRGPRSETRLVKFVPPSERETQRAAGRTVHNLGGYILNVARCEAGCAEELIATDPDWVTYV